MRSPIVDLRLCVVRGLAQTFVRTIQFQGALGLLAKGQDSQVLGYVLEKRDA